MLEIYPDTLNKVVRFYSIHYNTTLFKDLCTLFQLLGESFYFNILGGARVRVVRVEGGVLSDSVEREEGKATGQLLRLGGGGGWQTKCTGSSP